MTQQFLCIPEISTIVRLEEDWTFALYRDGRNWDLIELLCGEQGNRYDYHNAGKVVDFVTLNKGTELRVDRIYIRKGKSEYSSLTFAISKSTDSRLMVPGKGKKAKPVLKKARFWAKLADVNQASMLVVVDKSLEEVPADDES
jgi:hypothetical protein